MYSILASYDIDRVEYYGGWDLTECGWDLAESGWDLAEWLERVTAEDATTRNFPGFDPSISQNSEIWGAADEAVLNNEHNIFFSTYPFEYWRNVKNRHRRTDEIHLKIEKSYRKTYYRSKRLLSDQKYCRIRV